MEAVGGTAERVPDAREPAALEPLNPRVRLLWWAEGALTVLLLAAVALAADLLVRPPVPRGLLPALVLGVGGLLAAALPPLRHRRWRYALREQDLWIRQGVLWVTVSVIPFARLQFVDTRQGPLDRLFRLSSLVVHTAALGTSGRLPGLDVEEAERLRERLARVEVDAAGL
jgi:membrane protein YdbS with pleckstrin-like domain